MRLLVSDTVGFIRRLPHQLVEAFRSTLDETREATLILHVADASEPEARRDRPRRWPSRRCWRRSAPARCPRLLVLNKADRVAPDEREMLVNRHPDAVLVSARTGEGVDDLRDRLAAAARAGLTRLEVMVPYASGQVISAIYAAGRDVEQEPGERGHPRARPDARAGGGPHPGRARTAGADSAQTMMTGVPISTWR